MTDRKELLYSHLLISHMMSLIGSRGEFPFNRLSLSDIVNHICDPRILIRIDVLVNRDLMFNSKYFQVLELSWDDAAEAIFEW